MNAKRYSSTVDVYSRFGMVILSLVRTSFGLVCRLGPLSRTLVLVPGNEIEVERDVDSCPCFLTKEERFVVLFHGPLRSWKSTRMSSVVGDDQCSSLLETDRCGRVQLNIIGVNFKRYDHLGAQRWPLYPVDQNKESLEAGIFEKGLDAGSRNLVESPGAIVTEAPYW